MAKKNPTSVVLTKKAQKIKEQLAPGLGLKGILSVGLELFDQLSDKEKIERVGISITADKVNSKQPPKEAVREAIKELVAIEHEQPGTLIKIMSKEDSKIYAELRKALGPDPEIEQLAKSVVKSAQARAGGQAQKGRSRDRSESA